MGKQQYSPFVIIGDDQIHGPKPIQRLYGVSRELVYPSACVLDVQAGLRRGLYPSNAFEELYIRDILEGRGRVQTIPRGKLVMLGMLFMSKGTPVEGDGYRVEDPLIVDCMQRDGEVPENVILGRFEVEVSQEDGVRVIRPGVVSLLPFIPTASRYRGADVDRETGFPGRRDPEGEFGITFREGIRMVCMDHMHNINCCFALDISAPWIGYRPVMER